MMWAVRILGSQNWDRKQFGSFAKQNFVVQMTGTR